MTANDLIVLLLISTDDLDELLPPNGGPDDHKDWVNDALISLHGQALIQSVEGEFHVTARGLALIEHIKSLPLPVQTWRMPE